MRFGGRASRAAALTLIGAVLCATLAAASGARQDPAPQQPQRPEQPPEPQPPPDPQQPPIFRAGVNLVRVDVSVTDRDGKPIADLQPADFEIEEDGIRQKAETVQFLRLDGQQTPGSLEALDIRSQDHAKLEATRDDVRIFAIFFDEYHVDKAPSITTPMRDAIEQFVEMLGPTDLVAIMDPLTPLSALEFTRNRRELLDRVKKFEGRRNIYMPTRGLLEEAQLTRPNVWELRAGVSLSALNALVTYLGGLREGRKSVLFVSQGPPVGGAGNGLRQALDEAVQSANRANVTINVFDPRPLGGAPFGGADALFRMAHETGGRRIVNTNAPEKELIHVVEDASAYYLVGYAPAREFADGKFHKIDVRVTRRGARVEARRGYWAPKADELTAPEPEAPEEPGLRESLKKLAAPVEGQSVALWIGTSRGDGGKTRVTVSWNPSGRDRTVGSAEPVRERAVLLDVEPRNAAGVSLADARAIASAGVAADAATTAAFDLEPGDVVLRLEARDASGDTVDKWTSTITVPDLDDVLLALSTPRFLRARSPFELKLLRSAAAPPPTASRDFQRTDRVFVDVDCYRPADASTTLVAEILNNAGKVLTTLSVPPIAADIARVEVPMANLAIGNYVLRMKLSAGDQHTQQLVAFRVVP